MEEGRGNTRFLMMSAMLLTIVIIILIFAIVLPWWGCSISEKDQTDDGTVFDYTEDSEHISIGRTTEGEIGLHSSQTNLRTLLGVVTFLMLAAIFLSLLLLVSMIFYMTNRLNRIILPSILCVILIVTCLLCPIVFMVGIPISIEKDNIKEAEDLGEKYVKDNEKNPDNSFFGSRNRTEEGFWSSTEEIEENWGPDLGFFLPFIASLLGLGSLILLIIGRRRDSSGQL
jgi:hypothetical protein